VVVEAEENKMEFLGIVIIVGGLVWFGTRWFLKKEAAIIAKDNAAWELAKRDLQAFQQEVETTVEKKVEETVAVVEKKAVEVEQAVVKQVAKATKRKAKK
jgi:hypothetical protein